MSNLSDSLGQTEHQRPRYVGYDPMEPVVMNSSKAIANEIIRETSQEVSSERLGEGSKVAAPRLQLVSSDQKQDIIDQVARAGFNVRRPYAASVRCKLRWSDRTQQFVLQRAS